MERVKEGPESAASSGVAKVPSCLFLERLVFMEGSMEMARVFGLKGWLRWVRRPRTEVGLSPPGLVGTCFGGDTVEAERPNKTAFRFAFCSDDESVGLLLPPRTLDCWSKYFCSLLCEPGECGSGITCRFADRIHFGSQPLSPLDSRRQYTQWKRVLWLNTRIFSPCITFVSSPDQVVGCDWNATSKTLTVVRFSRSKHSLAPSNGLEIRCLSEVPLALTVRIDCVLSRMQLSDTQPTLSLDDSLTKRVGEGEGVTCVPDRGEPRTLLSLSK